MLREAVAVIFDLDGVLTDTAELHYQSWQAIADELGIAFDRQANEALRGLSREASLARLLGARLGEFSEAQRAEIARRKNEDYLRRVRQMTSGDLLPGALELLRGLRRRGALLAVASSSRNAGEVIERLGIRGLLDTVVDGNDAPRSKPDPQGFLIAATRLAVPPARCIVVEDAASGVEAALRAGMRVVGIGPPERVGQAHRVFSRIDETDPDRLLELVDSPPCAVQSRVAPRPGLGADVQSV